MTITVPVIEYFFTIYRDTDPCITARTAPLNENIIGCTLFCRPEYATIRPVRSGSNVKLKVKFRILTANTEILITTSGIKKAFPVTKLQFSITIYTCYRFTKVECVIASDKTPYKFKEGEVFSNRFEKISFKVAKDVNIPVESRVVPKNVVATIFLKRL